MRRVRAAFAIVPLLTVLAVFGSRETSATAAPTCFDQPATIFGRSGTINGTAGKDVIVGSDGPDVINGKGGNDVICGYGGADTIDGGTGNDWIRGDETSCTIADPADTMNGGAGNDLIIDSCGNNLAHGDSGSDTVSVTGRAYGDAGDDGRIDGYAQPGYPFRGYADGGSGDDDLVAANAGVAYGGAGNDTVVIFFDGDEAHGGSGNDRLQDNSANGVLDGGSGRDTCHQATTGDTLISCENVT
jgi:Ca2+-binding RTX toxin-like protein